MPEKDKVRRKEDEEFKKKCELVKKEVGRLERRAKEPIPEKILKMKFVI